MGAQVGHRAPELGGESGFETKGAKPPSAGVEERSGGNGGRCVVSHEGSEVKV